MAELKDFISSVLTEICEGVHEATARIEALGGVVNPRAISTSQPIEQHTRRAIVDVAFDVSIEATSSAGNTGRVGVLVATVGLGTQRSQDESHRSANSVKFTVPLVLPVDRETVEAEHRKEEDAHREATRAIRSSGMFGS